MPGHILRAAMMKKIVFSLLVSAIASLSLTCCGGGGGGGSRGDSKPVIIQQMIPQGYNSCKLDITDAFMGAEFEETQLVGTGNNGQFSIKSINMPASDTDNREISFDNIQGSWYFNPNDSAKNEVYLTVENHDAITEAPYQNYKLTRVVVGFESKARVADNVISGLTNKISISYVRANGSVGTKSFPFPANMRLTYTMK